jgi:hypothetical protein
MMAYFNSNNSNEFQSVAQGKPITSPTTLGSSSDFSLVTASNHNGYPVAAGTPPSESFLGWGVLMTFLVVATAFLKSIK